MADFLSKGKVKEIENSWNINIKLPEIMYDRKSEEYVLDKSNIKNFNIEEATLSNTKLAIKLNIRAEELLCNKDDSKEIIDKKINDYYYNNTGIRIYKEIYIENKLGYKFYLESNNDGSDLAKCMRKYIENKNIIKEHGENGRKRALKYFSSETNTKNIYEVYLDICARNYNK